MSGGRRGEEEEEEEEEAGRQGCEDGGKGRRKKRREGSWTDFCLGSENERVVCGLLEGPPHENKQGRGNREERFWFDWIKKKSTGGKPGIKKIFAKCV
jgi:hypothetical protein